MNHNTIRAYQFKADEAVRTLVEAGAQWVVGKGKPHWELPIEPKENLENMRDEIRVQFAKEVNERMIAFMATLVPQACSAPVMVEKGLPTEGFQYGPQNRYAYQQHAGKKFKLTRIPSWHGLAAEDIEESTIFTIEASTKLDKRMYSGIAVLFSHKGKQCWIPVTCIQVLQEV